MRGVSQSLAVNRERSNAAVFVVDDDYPLSGHDGTFGVFEAVRRVQGPEKIAERGMDQYRTA